MKIQLFATYRDIVNNKVVEVPFLSESHTADEILEELIKQYPAFQLEFFDENRKLRPGVNIFVNGRNIIHLQGLETRVTPDMEVAIIPPVGGG